MSKPTLGQPLFDMSDPKVAQYFGAAPVSVAPSIDIAPPAAKPGSSAALAEHWGQPSSPPPPANDFGLGALGGAGPAPGAPAPTNPFLAPPPPAPVQPPPPSLEVPGQNHSSPNEDPSRMMSVAAPAGSAPGAAGPQMSVDPRPAPKPAGPPPPARAPMGGGGGDFGVGKARSAVYATFPREQGDIQGLADVEKSRAEAKAAGMGVLGADQMAQAERMQREAEVQNQFFGAYQAETDKQLDMVRARQVDPTRLMKDGGTKAAAIIGGILGGIYQGINKTAKNPFIDDLNSMITQDIGIQEREIERDFRSVQERKSMLGQMREVYKDKQVAQLQAMNLYYEGFKTQLAAEVAQYDAPAIQQRANAAITQVERQQASLKLNDAMQNAARAAAQAAFMRAEAQRKFENYLKFEDMTTRRFSSLGYDKGDQITPRFVPLGSDPSTGEAVGFLARDKDDAAKLSKANMKMMQIDALANKALAMRAEMGTLGRAIHNQGMYGVYTPDWQQELRSIEQQLKGAIKDAMDLGALDNGVERFAQPITGQLDSVGSGADVRLKALLDANKMARESMVGSIAGPRARFDGRAVRLEGGIAGAPTNTVGSQGVQREAP